MITKLPRWIWASTWVLAFMAGIINVVSLLGIGHETITHLTGSTSRLAEAIAKIEIPTVHHTLLLMGAFMLGTAMSGFIVPGRELELDRRYSSILILESILLFLSIPLYKYSSSYGAYSAACACGLQNAMVSTYSGSIVRTTHLSGMFTDLGVSIGHSMRGLPLNKRRLSLCLVVITGFLCGGIFGARAFQAFDYETLFFPACLAAVCAVVFKVTQKNEKLPRDQ